MVEHSTLYQKVVGLKPHLYVVLDRSVYQIGTVLVLVKDINLTLYFPRTSLVKPYLNKSHRDIGQAFGVMVIGFHCVCLEMDTFIEAL